MTQRDAHGRFTKATPLRELVSSYEPIFDELVAQWRDERPDDLALVAAHVRIPDVDFTREAEQ